MRLQMVRCVRVCVEHGFVQDACKFSFVGVLLPPLNLFLLECAICARINFILACT